MFLLAIFAGIVYANFAVSAPSSNNVCKTPGCIEAASTILSNMDPSIKPCDNFYEFACGGYLKKTIIPKDKSSVTEYNNLNENIRKNLKNNIENEIKEKDPRAFKLLKTFYLSCMDTETVEETSIEDFFAILKKIGNWPVLKGNSWDESKFDWKELVYKLRNTGYSIKYFIDFSIDIDSKNNTKRIISLDQPSLGLSQKYLSKGMDEKIVQSYYELMIDLAEILGAERQEAKKELMESLNFEIALAKISLPSEERRNMTKLYNLMTINEVQSKYPDIKWLEYINRILEPNVQLTSDEQINVIVPSYLEAFSKLVKKTPKRVLANYAMWRVTFASSSSLGERVQDALNKFQASTSGISSNEARWMECVSIAKSYLNLATSALYIRRNFDESAKESAIVILKDIRRSFRNIIKEVDWMDEGTRKFALDKFDNIKPYIAYPDEFLDDGKLDKYYKKLEIAPDTFLQNKLNINLFQRTRGFDQFRKPINKTSWISHSNSAVANAFYNPSENSMEFPAGIFQGLFFSNDRPRYLNYGIIGWTMGHEMTHGFDDEGSQFDKDGNLVDWWDPETKKKYLQRAKCIVDQYSNYTVKEIGLNLNGKNSQGENIADNGGIKEAYFAYNDWEQRNGVEPALPGLPYNPQQMFWIAAANKWCSKYTLETLRSRVITGVHSPGEFRIIGPLSNRPEFAEDFNCPLGSNMNPIKKCSVW